jgi:hypothetical protein
VGATANGVPLKELDQVIMVLREPSSITRRTFDQACAQAAVNHGCCWSWTAAKR